MPRKKKSNKTSSGEENEGVKKAPHSFVFHRGKVGICIIELIRDMRRVMEPYTATKLKVLKKNVLKDFATVAGPLGVSHFLIFSRTEIALNMRLVCLPRGPTLTFRVHNYTLNRDVISSLKKPQSLSQKYFNHPLIVMNNFKSDQRHLKLTETAFQNMFPSINVHKVKLQDVQRCVLLNYDSEQDTIQFRHYVIKLVSSGVSNPVKKLLRKRLPDMGKYADISDYFLKPTQSSDSECETAEVKMPMENGQQKNNGHGPNQVSIRLIEVGPRMTLQLIKIQEGFCDGEVLYHKFVKKTAAQREAIRKAKIAKQRLREKRRKEQEKNVARKKSLEKRVKFQVTESSQENEREPKGKRLKENE